jgi:Ni/Fe-hydrogenase subunit HybB-like protein
MCNLTLSGNVVPTKSYGLTFDPTYAYDPTKEYEVLLGLGIISIKIFVLALRLKAKLLNLIVCPII